MHKTEASEQNQDIYVPTSVVVSSGTITDDVIFIRDRFACQYKIHQ